MTYFSRQPGDIGYCPVCRSRIGIISIPPSKNALKEIDENSSLIAVHCFSRLYECSTCSWSAIRESWAYYECNSTADYLIVCEKANNQHASWDQLLQNENIYQNIKSLPEELGKLFQGGTKALHWSTMGHIIARTMVYKSLLDQNPPSLLTQGSQVSIVSFETYKANFMQQQFRDRYWSQKPLNLQLIEDMLHKVEQKIRQGGWHAVRLDKIESELIEKSGDYALCKEGEIYLVEVSNIDRRVN